LSFLVLQAITLLCTLLIAAAAGTAITGSRPPLALRAILGLAVTGQLFVLLAMSGQLRPWSLIVFAILAVVAGISRSRWLPIEWRSLATLGAITIPLGTMALYPPMAFDETLYHLPFVRALAESGTTRFLPEVRFPIFPQFHELLCVPAFLVSGDVGTHFVALTELLLLVALLIHWPDSKRAGLLAAALLLGNPIVLQLATVTHVEMALTLFVTAGFYCLDRSWPGLTGKATSHEENVGGQGTAATTRALDYVSVAGFFFGTACSVKYLAAYFAAAAFIVLGVFAAERRRAIPRFVFWSVAGALPTYATIARLTGNPVFPFLPGFFGSSPWALTPASPVPLSPRVLWDMTFAREHLNFQPPYSPLFALALAVTIVAAFRSRRAAIVATIGVFYFAVFTLLPQDSRYLLPLVPLTSICAARALTFKFESVPSGRLALAALSLLSLAAGAAYVTYRIAQQGPPPLNSDARRRYLEAHIPEYRALERRGPGRIYVAGAEQLKYFGGDDLIGDVEGPLANDRIFGGSSTSGQLADALTALHARYLLISRRTGREAWRKLPAQPRFERVYADAGAELWRVVQTPADAR
jgi:hypothetical protein